MPTARPNTHSPLSGHLRRMTVSAPGGRAFRRTQHLAGNPVGQGKPATSGKRPRQRGKKPVDGARAHFPAMERRARIAPWAPPAARGRLAAGRR